jgi:hypothetical protein
MVLTSTSTVRELSEGNSRTATPLASPVYPLAIEKKKRSIFCQMWTIHDRKWLSDVLGSRHKRKWSEMQYRQNDGYQDVLVP